MAECVNGWEGVWKWQRWRVMDWWMQDIWIHG